MSGRVRGERRRSVKGKALSASWDNVRVAEGAAFARGGSSYALERNPSTVRYAASQSGRAVD